MNQPVSQLFALTYTQNTLGKTDATLPQMLPNLLNYTIHALPVYENKLLFNLEQISFLLVHLWHAHHCTLWELTGLCRCREPATGSKPKPSQIFFYSTFTHPGQSIKKTFSFTNDSLAKGKSWPLGGFKTNTEALWMSVQQTEGLSNLSARI